MNFPDPNPVRLIDYVDVREGAWRLSRPNLSDDPVDMQALSLTPFTLNDCAHFYFQFQDCPSILRELIASMRPFSIWAQTSRIKKIQDNRLAQIYWDHDPIMANEYTGRILCIDQNLSQDVARSELPIAVRTSWTAGASFRTWVCFLVLMKNHAPQLYNYYCQPIVEALKLDDMEKYQAKYGDIYESVALTDEETYSSDRTEVAMGVTAMKITGTFSFVAQFARHQHNKFRTSLWRHADDLEWQIKNKFCTQISIITHMPSQSYRDILSHRSSWLASWVEWANFVEVGTQYMTSEEFFNLLPSGTTYLEDNMGRIQLKDPNLPDPTLIDDPRMVEQRIAREGNNYIASRWQDLARLGYLRDDPTNDLRLQYEANLQERDKGV